MLKHRVFSAVTLIIIMSLLTPVVSAAQWFATDSALEFGYSLSDFLGSDQPALRNNVWFAPDRSYHDSWLYDYGKFDVVEDRYMVWSTDAVNQFKQKPELNLVHQVIVDNNIYEADSYISSNIPNINHNEDESEFEEGWQGYEEKEVGTTTPENLQPGTAYYVKTWWETLQNAPAHFTTDSELTKCGYVDCWSPAGHQELGEMYFQSTNNDRWYYNSTAYRQGWSAVNATASSVSNGIFYINPAGSDPYITSPPLVLNAADYKRVELRMASNMLDGYGNIYFKTSEFNYYSEDKNISFGVGNCRPNICSGKASFQNYSVYMGYHPLWRGTITGIRIDPGNNGVSGSSIDTVGIDFIKLSR